MKIAVSSDDTIETPLSDITIILPGIILTRTDEVQDCCQKVSTERVDQCIASSS